MASLLESVAISRSSSFVATPLSAPVTVPAICALSRDRKVRSLPESIGLRIQSSDSKLRLGRLRSARVSSRRGGVVVCEAQETALQG